MTLLRRLGRSSEGCPIFEVSMPFEQNLIAGLHAGLCDWARSTGAFSVARNGGAEFALRAHLLPFLEDVTSCLAFTESGGVRIISPFALFARPKRRSPFLS